MQVVSRAATVISEDFLYLKLRLPLASITVNRYLSKNAQMKKTIALFYQSYALRRTNHPYIKTLGTISLGIVLLVFLLGRVINLYPLKYVPFYLRLFVLCCSVVLLGLLLSLFFEKEELGEFRFTESELKKMANFNRLYTLFVCALIIVVLLLRFKHLI